jgi:hypothetical protein
MEIQEFRIGQNTQVKVNNRWYKLRYFSDGTFGIKKTVSLAFNPYFIFNSLEAEKINNFLK